MKPIPKPYKCKHKEIKKKKIGGGGVGENNERKRRMLELFS